MSQFYIVSSRRRKTRSMRNDSPFPLCSRHTRRFFLNKAWIPNKTQSTSVSCFGCGKSRAVEPCTTNSRRFSQSWVSALSLGKRTLSQRVPIVISRKAQSKERKTTKEHMEAMAQGYEEQRDEHHLAPSKIPSTIYHSIYRKEDLVVFLSAPSTTLLMRQLRGLADPSALDRVWNSEESGNRSHLAEIPIDRFITGVWIRAATAIFARPSPILDPG